MQRSRRWFLRAGALWSSVLVACRGKTDTPAASTEPRTLGTTVSSYGSRSRFETAARDFVTNTRVPLEEAASRTPLHDTYGIITPSSLHFERHHSGVPEIDPAVHTLTIHGLVDRPLAFTIDELKRLPSISRIHFLECSGNSLSEWRGGSTESSVQRIHGLTSCSEWTGVSLAVLLRECGIQPAATWLLAEGADASKHARSIPIAKAMDDAMVAYGQNGEPLRPEQGYPMRLFLPGWEGNANVKWLRRVKALDQPAMTREETSKYTDLMPDGTARQFTFVMEPKSLITRPWRDREGRDHDRRRHDVERRGSPVACPAARAHTISFRLAMGWPRGGARVALHRRHRLHAAAAHRSHRGARHELVLSQQRDSDVEGRGRREDHEWESRLACCSRPRCTPTPKATACPP